MIFSKSAEEHIEHVKTVIFVLRQQSILVTMSECVWGRTELPYLGHNVSEDGIKVDPKRVQAVADWPEPTSLNEIQQFLGLTILFRKYIQGYSTLTGPLTGLLRKNTPFHFLLAVKMLCRLEDSTHHSPCLALPDTTEGGPEFDLVCDASGIGLGGVLLQSGRHIALWSRKMLAVEKAVEKNYHVTEQKLLAVIEALGAFRCHIDGVHFDLITDHKPNTYLDTQPTMSRRQTRWSEHLQRFNFTWEYKCNGSDGVTLCLTP